MQMGIMCLKGDSSDWIILECSIGVSRCLRVGDWSRLMLLPGWPFTVYRCCKSHWNWRNIGGLMKVPPSCFAVIDADIASKFFEHFLFIADAMSFDSKDEGRISLWHKEDGFYYDAINWGGPFKAALPIKSLVGLIPLFAVMVL